MKYKYFLIIFLSTLFLNSGFSQTHKIDVKISDLKSAEIYLGYYYAGKTYVKDTIKLDENGKGTFSGDTLLDQGIYIIVLPSKNYFDILIGEDQEFSVGTSSEGLLENLKIKGSTENIAFDEFQRFMKNISSESSIIQSRLKELDENSDSTQILKDQLNSLTSEVNNYWDNAISENKGTLFSVVLKATKNIEVPEIEIPDHIQNKDSVRWFHSYNYNRQHYFDNIDFSDERILRTPFFDNKLETFFTKVLIQNPDTLNRYIDIVASRAESSEEMFEYVIRFFMNTYSSSDIMGMDKVLVHIAETYYLNDKVDWYGEENIKKLSEHVAKLRFNLIGNIAQDLKMETINEEYTRLYEINAKYTLVYFWEPDCGHCKKVTPKIHELYNEFSREEFEVIAVYTQTDKEEWIKYINDHDYNDWINAWDPYNLTNFRFFYNIFSTPTIYLLDENKKIIAKRIGYDTLKNILEIALGRKDIANEIKKERD
ncbi:MAG: thioredoxin-like domain-containing protein [Bacteroidales bacterium]|jgi:thiol-disulfide isomerase/thioredoxin|nr:thioredoxin-like domain-containing protein [Bacteroidales bacterium]